MRTLPKTLLGFYIKYALHPRAAATTFVAVIFLHFIYQASAGIIYPLSERWFVALFEQTAPSGMSFLSFAMPTIILIIGLAVAIDVLEILHSIIYGRWKPRVRDNLGVVINDYLHGQSMSFWTTRMAGKINTQINYIIGGILTTHNIVAIVAALAVIVANTGMLVNINRNVAYILGAIFLFRLIYSIIIMRPLNRAAKDQSEASSSVSGKIVDGIANYSIVKLFAGIHAEKKYLAPARERYISASIKSRFIERLFWAVPGFIWDISFGLTLITCAIFYQRGEMLVSEIVFTVSAYFSVLNGISRIVNAIPDLVESIGSAVQAYHELIKPIDVADMPDAPDLKVGKGAIEIKNVSFKYHKKLVLDNFNLKIAPGEKIGLVGGSGAGKTTIVNLLMRFYDPTKGAISIDGQDIKNVAQDSLRRNIAFIPQDASMFNRTLKDNIAYGRAGATEAQIQRAAKHAAAHEFIMAAPKKYKSLVGERGIKLSGGQKQRVAIARAFLKNAPILILDEATSALDSETEAAIQKSFLELSRGKTTIAVAHRLSTLRHVDRIVVVEKGKIAEQGTHANLLKKRGGIYAKLWKMQSGGFISE